MPITTKLPESRTAIAKMMGVTKEEAMAWPYFEDVRNAFKDFNLGVLHKEGIICKLNTIMAKCNYEHYRNGIGNIISTIKRCY